jgi:5'-methylthioadenosine phosphorylase
MMCAAHERQLYQSRRIDPLGYTSAQRWRFRVQERPKLGIIGGSGLYQLTSLVDVESLEWDTPFGRPSDAIRVGTIAGRRVAFISRHGAGHRLAPDEVPYAANVCAFKQLGVEQLVSISAVGSLLDQHAPRSFVIPDQIIDRTVGRRRSFFGEGVVAHVSIAEPFCGRLSAELRTAAIAGGLPVHLGGTYVCIEGPQFSTQAESRLFQSWGASIIGMTAMPEARLAREAELCYACLAMVTDYDVWHEHEGPVNVETVLSNLRAMTDGIQRIVVALARAPATRCDAGCRDALGSAIVTSPEAIPDGARGRLRPIAGRYWTT